MDGPPGEWITGKRAKREVQRKQVCFRGLGERTEMRVVKLDSQNGMPCELRRGGAEK